MSSSGIESACAVVKKAAPLNRDGRLKMRVLLVARQQVTLDKCNGFVQHHPVAGGSNILADGKWQPVAIVGEMGTHAATGRPSRPPP